MYNKGNAHRIFVVWSTSPASGPATVYTYDRATEHPSTQIAFVCSPWCSCELHAKLRTRTYYGYTLKGEMVNFLIFTI
jgi:hypothetical protein